MEPSVAGAAVARPREIIKIMAERLEPIPPIEGAENIKSLDDIPTSLEPGQTTFERPPPLVDWRARDLEAAKRQVAMYDAALAQLDAELATLEAGAHPEFAARAAPLYAQRDARIARAARDHEAELATLDRLRDHEVRASDAEVRRRVQALEETLADRLAARRGGQPVETSGSGRALRSKDSDGRRSPNRKGGAAALLDTGLTEAEMQDDFVAIATAHGCKVEGV
mmetsp:Transcript_364/g.1019  ORF Transcript_364/g.1019 Transcript_364/m.1019 type:complete len:225 (+) Transcript_364:207-881(+)